MPWPVSLRALARALAMFASVAAAAGCIVVNAGAASTPPNLFFDDFSYAHPGELASGGWQLRDGVGHPGLPGGRFAACHFVDANFERKQADAVSG